MINKESKMNNTNYKRRIKYDRLIADILKAKNRTYAIVAICDKFDLDYFEVLDDVLKADGVA
jgi:hypothetical protein